mmetsp:Transcript_16831/g.52257  ORF Transcript_16831/g.52257 Transcript_16831/m.52257 type:complete len:499 (-) Transcript_16831:269-1765(-)
MERGDFGRGRRHSTAATERDARVVHAFDEDGVRRRELDGDGAVHGRVHFDLGGQGLPRLAVADHARALAVLKHGDARPGGVHLVRVHGRRIALHRDRSNLDRLVRHGSVVRRVVVPHVEQAHRRRRRDRRRTRHRPRQHAVEQRGRQRFIGGGAVDRPRNAFGEHPVRRRTEVREIDEVGVRVRVELAEARLNEETKEAVVAFGEFHRGVARVEPREAPVGLAKEQRRVLIRETDFAAATETLGCPTELHFLGVAVDLGDLRERALVVAATVLQPHEGDVAGRDVQIGLVDELQAAVHFGAGDERATEQHSAVVACSRGMDGDRTELLRNYPRYRVAGVPTVGSNFFGIQRHQRPVAKAWRIRNAEVHLRVGLQRSERERLVTDVVSRVIRAGDCVCDFLAVASIASRGQSAHGALRQIGNRQVERLAHSGGLRLHFRDDWNLPPQMEVRSPAVVVDCCPRTLVVVGVANVHFVPDFIAGELKDEEARRVKLVPLNNV